LAFLLKVVSELELLGVNHFLDVPDWSQDAPQLEENIAPPCSEHIVDAATESEHSKGGDPKAFVFLLF
jgi:hypothetical protein